ncbi:MAG: hypothetical protein ACRDYA_11870 [Egibacteraceae bacterium]
MSGSIVPTFSPEDGLLRLPADGLRALAAWGQRPRARRLRADETEATSLLTELGVVGPDGVHPLLHPVSKTLARPLVRIDVRVGFPASPSVVNGWVVPGWAVFSLPVRGTTRGLRDIVAVHPTRVPGVVAMVTSLGPRPIPCLPAPVVLPTAAARALVFAQGGLDQAAVLDAAKVEEPWRGALERLAALRIRTWAARSRWAPANQVASRALRVVDGGEAGLWIWTDATVEGRPVTQLVAVASSVVWRHVTALLPDGDDRAP